MPEIRGNHAFRTPTKSPPCGGYTTGVGDQARPRSPDAGAVMDVVTIDTPEMGDRSYLVTDGRSALVVDPQRDIERFTRAAADRGLTITNVVETHIHNDYLSGGLSLARATGARYGISGLEAVTFASEREPLTDGDRFAVGELLVHVVATPGHTPSHLSFVVARPGAGTDEVAVFSGGSLLYGAAGRTDLTGPGLTDLLARAQWRSIRHLADLLPGHATVHPTHGFGSFCTAGGGAAVNDLTIGRQRASNPALILRQEDFVDDLIRHLVDYPRYYAHMGPRNRVGAPPVDFREPPQVGLIEIAERVARGEWVVDIRARRAFAAQHLPGTVNIELGKQLATYLGWVIPWGTPLSLVAETREQIAEARRGLARIGLDGVAAVSLLTRRDLEGPALSQSYPVATFADLDLFEAHSHNHVVLDVRHSQEWAAGHLPGALHIAVQDLDGAASALAPDCPIWVHCAAGYRAALGCSLLDRRGFQVILIDDRWDLARVPIAA